MKPKAKNHKYCVRKIDVAIRFMENKKKESKLL